MLTPFSLRIHRQIILLHWQMAVQQIINSWMRKIYFVYANSMIIDLFWYNHCVKDCLNSLSHYYFVNSASVPL